MNLARCLTRTPVCRITLELKCRARCIDLAQLGTLSECQIKDQVVSAINIIAGEVAATPCASCTRVEHESKSGLVDAVDDGGWDGRKARVVGALPPDCGSLTKERKRVTMVSASQH